MSFLSTAGLRAKTSYSDSSLWWHATRWKFWTWVSMTLSGFKKNFQTTTSKSSKPLLSNWETLGPSDWMPWKYAKSNTCNKTLSRWNRTTDCWMTMRKAMMWPFSCLKKTKRSATRTQIKVMPQTQAAPKMSKTQMPKRYKQLLRRSNPSWSIPLLLGLVIINSRKCRPSMTREEKCPSRWTKLRKTRAKWYLG
jgi:hypothetical protein